MRSRSHADVQLARPLGRVFPEPLASRLGVVKPARSIIEEMLDAEEAQRAKRLDFGGRPPAPPATKISTPPPRPAPVTAKAPAAGRPEPAPAPATPAPAATLPPIVPADDEAFYRAIALLSACAKGQVGKAAKKELPRLLGALPPDAKVAHTWKITMMAQRKRGTK